METLEDKLDASFYDKALDFASREVKHNIIDALVCTFHNEGYSLDGNTDETDVNWFADVLYRATPGTRQSRLSGQSEVEQREWQEKARIAIECFPALASRVSNRMIRLSQMCRTILQEERARTAIKKVR